MKKRLIWLFVVMLFIGTCNTLAKHGDNRSFNRHWNRLVSLRHSGIHRFCKGFRIGDNHALQAFGQTCKDP